MNSSDKNGDVASVSVITVNFNGKRHLKACFSSLIEVNYPCSKYEIIMVDNGSTDGSIDYVRNAFPCVRIIELKRNTGWVGGINAGVKYANGEYVIVLNNDVYVDKQWMIELVRSLDDESTEIGSSKNFLTRDHSILDAAGCTNNIIGQGWDIGMLKKYNGEFEFGYEITHPGGASCITKRRVIKNYGYLLDPDYFISQDDLDLGWRARLLGFKVVYAPKGIAYHERGGTSSVSPSSFYYFLRNMFITYYKNLEEANLNKVLFLVVENIFLTSIFEFMRSRDINFMVNLVRIARYIKRNKKEIMEKRKRVQNIRKVSDKKIFSLFSTLIIAPNEVKRFSALPRFFLALLNLYIGLTKIPVEKFEGIYYY